MSAHGGPMGAHKGRRQSSGRETWAKFESHQIRSTGTVPSPPNHFFIFFFVYNSRSTTYGGCYVIQYIRPIFVDLHRFLLIYDEIFDKTTFSSKSCTPSSSFQKRHGQNDRRKRGNISCVRSESRLTTPKTKHFFIFEGNPRFSDLLYN